MSNAFTLDTQRPWQLINQCPAYQPTPLREIITPAGHRCLIKDETSRFDLGAFKALGGIYAVAAFLLEKWQTDAGAGAALDPQRLFDEDLRHWSKQFTFVCASAGNHGMAVANGAKLFNANSRIYLAESVPESFERNLLELDAEVIRAGKTYEDSMRTARAECESGNATEILLADSSWPGYSKMPLLVMAGYTVLAEELRLTFSANNDWPSHVFLQAGVGGLAAAIAFHIRQHWQQQPQIIVVEPEAAPCLFESHRKGRLTSVTGPVSSMGRLDCKEASMLAFTALQQYADRFICISESEAAAAVSFLEKNDIATTPSGAAGVAALNVAPRLKIPLEEDAVCLALVTEGQLSANRE